MSKPRGLLSFVLASAIASACGASDAPTKESSTGGLTQAEFAHEYCAMVKPCCEGDGLPTTGCAAAIKAFLPSHFDGAAGRACLESVRAASSVPKFCVGGAARLLEHGCTALASERGAVPVGGTCSKATKGADCAPSAEGPVGCLGSPIKATCVLQLVGDEGASPCIGTTEGAENTTSLAPPRAFYCDSSKGLHCDDPTGAAGVCRKAVVEGAACPFVADDPCEAAAYCSNRTCRPRSTIGAPCLQGYASASACPIGSYCDDVQCTTLLADGAACTRGDPHCTSGACQERGSCGPAFDTKTPDSWATRICTP